MAEGGRLTSLLWALLLGLEAPLALGSLILSLASESEMSTQLQKRVEYVAQSVFQCTVTEDMHLWH